MELASGAKIFVRPAHYAPALEAIRRYNIHLYNDHVLVDVELESVVMQAVKRVPAKQNIYPRRKDFIPIELAHDYMESDVISALEEERRYVHYMLQHHCSRASRVSRTIELGDYFNCLDLEFFVHLPQLVWASWHHTSTRLCSIARPSPRHLTLILCMCYAEYDYNYYNSSTT